MIILFGWGHQMVKNNGPVFRHQCPHCNQDVFLELHDVSRWFTLFFIPIFPYATDHLLLCPICSYGAALDVPTANRLRLIAENNVALVEGRITREEYTTRMSAVAVN